MKRQFIEEETQTANKHMKKCSVSLEIRKMQIRVTKRYHFSVFRLQEKNLHSPRITSTGEDRGDNFFSQMKNNAGE